MVQPEVSEKYINKYYELLKNQYHLTDEEIEYLLLSLPYELRSYEFLYYQLELNRVYELYI